ncbi:MULTISPECIES: hypothetical protein [Sphingomonas]|uniref:Uncharacterized protein n=1 Tax=Edaphosphingomonas fennica TaxID=114404 RepID=A0A2T4HU74_9SPHN|nr:MULTISPECIES: hypothetical protein [Sphingomonas]AGH48100.1 hypothetical protein G432_01860 [Sphingomonas sp. MM-1]PTD19310.1 hypothetical protein CV103_13165 [Sphingomonas fennica]
MRIYTVAGLLLCSVSMMISGPAMAQNSGYQLLVENGVDAIAVRHVIADRLGEPAATGSISRQILNDPQSMARLRADAAGRQTIVVGAPDLIRAMGGGAGGVRRISTDLARVLPAETLAVARID